MSSGDSRSATTKSTEISIASSRGKSRPPTRFSHGSSSDPHEVGASNVGSPRNLCDLSKGYFATTFLSSSPPTPASQSGLHELTYGYRSNSAQFTRQPP